MKRPELPRFGQAIPWRRVAQWAAAAATAGLMLAGAVAQAADTYPSRPIRLVVPFAMPLLIGPGAISTAVIYASETKRFGWSGFAAGLGVVTAVSLTIVVAFWLTGLISRVLGRIGMTIVVRVLGLILCAMAVQFIIAGLADPSIGVIRPEAATPYADLGS